MTGWPAAVDQLGSELEAAIARRERRRRLRLPRFVPPVALAVLLISAVAIGATGVIREGVPIPWWGDDVQQAARPLPLEPIRAPDPAGGPPWGIRVSTAGPLLCQTIGQVMGGRIGVVRGRLFHALPPQMHDGCTRVPAGGAVVRWSQYPGANVASNGARTVVHGLVGRQVVRVEVLRGAVSRTLTPSKRGAFVTAFAGLHSPRELKVRVTASDGSKTIYGGRR